MRRGAAVKDRQLPIIMLYHNYNRTVIYSTFMVLSNI